MSHQTRDGLRPLAIRRLPRGRGAGSLGAVGRRMARVCLVPFGLRLLSAGAACDEASATKGRDGPECRLGVDGRLAALLLRDFQLGLALGLTRVRLRQCAPARSLCPRCACAGAQAGCTRLCSSIPGRERRSAVPACAFPRSDPTQPSRGRHLAAVLAVV